MTRRLLPALVLVVLLAQVACQRGQVRSRPAQAQTDTQRPGTYPDTVTRPTATTAAPAAGAPALVDARAHVAQLDFTYLTARSKLSFTSKTQDYSNATLHLRMRKDSLIWLSVSRLGIEGVRALISRDSIVIMDKIRQEYTVTDFAGLSRQFNLDLTYELLQAMLVGNLPFPALPAQAISGERTLLLRQQAGRVLIENYIGPPNRKLNQLRIAEPGNQHSLQLNYEEFGALNNFVFPYASLLTLDYRAPADGPLSQTQIRIKHNKVELVDKNPGFPFTIPAKYPRH